MSRDTIPGPVMRAQAARVAEAAGLLATLKPYLKRAGTLTAAEGAVFQAVIDQVHEVMSAAWRELTDARYPGIWERAGLDVAEQPNGRAIRKAD